MHSWRRILSTLALLSSAVAVPAPSSVTSAPAATPTVPYASDDPNYPLWNEDENIVPEPVRGSLGASILGPQNIPIELQNPDIFAPPTTDSGSVPNFKWPFSLSPNRLQTGGWARQQNINDMSVATDLAGVNMRLEVGAIREMHWHNDGEWAYVIQGDLRVSTVTPDGQVYVGDVSQGDLWYFPAGYPHSIQAKNTTAGGAEFLLIFDSGSFSEDSTFLLTDWLAHVPKEVIAKNFQVNISAFDHIPSRELYIFPSTPPPVNVESDMVVPNDTPMPFTFAMSQVNATQGPGGTYKVVDSRTFPVATTVCSAEVTVEVGGMRELHWHPTEPEWTYFISGQARITVYASSAQATTMDFQAGDIAYIPPSYGHYVENTGTSTLLFLEIFRSALFQDISLTQWLALTPHELVKAHLGLDDATIDSFSRVKQEVVGPAH
ncbi:putative oxalate decarboxylase/oxidase [Suillus subaureus]|uniref:Oxalate decarboxylase/oxidase n=1 Tax=Suillus subaureus TaxID=48587 RepID=A0A9P7EJ84_9AGAM|nr:putative oxalate decarboxylase/oxidase [Suillus subaureus]KAG1823517.1 putative oxalate decarboxylase/oxidase [Suillus subaureus]